LHFFGEIGAYYFLYSEPSGIAADPGSLALNPAQGESVFTLGLAMHAAVSNTHPQPSWPSAIPHARVFQ
jgi:hypothetical protein